MDHLEDYGPIVLRVVGTIAGKDFTFGYCLQQFVLAQPSPLGHTGLLIVDILA
jgi:hypothetical protein